MKTRFLKPRPSRRRAFVTNLLGGESRVDRSARHERENDYHREIARRLETEPVVGGVRIIRRRIGDV